MKSSHETVPSNELSEDTTGIAAIEQQLGITIPDAVKENQDEQALAQILQETMNGDENLREVVANMDLPESIAAQLNWNGETLLEREDPQEGEAVIIDAQHITELQQWSGDQGIETVEDAKKYFLNAGLDENALADAPIIYDLLVKKGMLEA